MSRGTYQDFFKAMRVRESGDNYSAVNKYGYAGAYQFGEAALIDLGYAPKDANVYDNVYSKGFTGKNGIGSIDDFLKSPAEQDAAAGAWFTLLWNRIRYYDLEFYTGQTLNGTTLTKSGMIAATHLVGTQKLIDFVKSGGTAIAADANGTSILDYLRKNNVYTAETGQPLDIQPLRELATASQDGGGRMVVYRRDPEVLRFHLPMPRRVLQPRQKSIMAFEQGVIARTGGTEVRLPGAMAYADEITAPPA